jgi:hypothetical protein
MYGGEGDIVRALAAKGRRYELRWRLAFGAPAKR